jgi:hypothetical protein
MCDNCCKTLLRKLISIEKLLADFGSGVRGVTPEKFDYVHARVWIFMHPSIKKPVVKHEVL